MAWFRRRSTEPAPAHSTEGSGPPAEGVQLLTAVGAFRKKVDAESAELGDRVTVRRWVRELRPGADQTVLVTRSWGAVAASGHPVTVTLTDGEKSWYAVAPGAPASQDLTPRQVEQVVLAALDSPDRPEWPQWLEL
jgi:hypothetical protein